MKLKNIISALIAVLVLQACDDGFLDRYPLSQFSEETFFNTENDLKLYLNNFYASLPIQTWNSDEMSDNMASRNINSFLAGNYVVPNTDGNWAWGMERQLNYFLQRHGKATISPELKSRYEAEARLFRAYTYWRKVVRYGDVPWLNKDLNEESPELYEPRTPRKTVMDSVLADLNFAVQHLPQPAGAEMDRLNRDIALAFKARIALWEGTFRKYHGLGDEEPFLNEAANAAQELIEAGRYQIYSTGNPEEDYRELFIQEELRGNPEAIMARRYVRDVAMHNTTRQIGDNWPSFTKNFVRSYLSTDGLPTALSPLYQGDDHPDLESENRDPRYKQTIITRGYVMAREATGPTDVVTLPRIPSTVTGYASSKWRSPDPIQWVANQSTLDLFILRYAETLLIYAEAKAELGELNQTIVDNTINKIRERVGMAPMVLTSLVKDPESDFPALSVELDEIRRERRIELAGDGFRFDDLLRWKAGDLIENPETILGMKLTPALVDEYEAANVNIGGVVLDSDHYIRVYPNFQSRVWEDKMYRYPLPLQELELNPQLAPQNPGW